MNLQNRFENFLTKANLIHNNFYNYDNVAYLNAKNKVIITCPLHGNFEQTPDNHLLKKGCPLCKNEKISKKNTKLSSEKFLNIAKEKFKNLDFSETIYKNRKTKITFRCHLHGRKTTLPKSILNGTGCLTCFLSKNKKTKDFYIKKAINIHKNFYEYSLLEKEFHCKSKQKIICPVHGIFTQSIDNHLQGYGCKKCGIDKIKLHQKKNAIGWSYKNWSDAGKRSKHFESFKVYIIKCYKNDEQFYKVGKTFLKINRRFSNKKDFKYNFKVEKIFIFKCGIKASKFEEELKRKNKEFKYIPKIFFKGMNECFKKLQEKGESNLEDEN